MADVKTKWLASLSDGTTAIEGDGQYTETAGGLSPWLTLQKHLANTGLHITGMRIQVSKTGKAIRTYNLPSRHKTPSGKHEKWPAIRPMVPQQYNYFRWIASSRGDGIPPQRHIEIRSIYGDVIVSLFVDENEGNESWVVVHENPM